ncbi:hypothetical protein DBP20_32495 [Streptomyces sp. CS131]|nr:hypothetical protein DBP20_32495 [Streptomyces sp. CS131]
MPWHGELVQVLRCAQVRRRVGRPASQAHDRHRGLLVNVDGGQPQHRCKGGVPAGFVHGVRRADAGSLRGRHPAWWAGAATRSASRTARPTTRPARTGPPGAACHRYPRGTRAPEERSRWCRRCGHRRAGRSSCGR